MSGLTLEKRGWILFASGETAMSVAGVNQHHKDATEHRRRIVAAVNATADIPVEALEAGVIAQILEAAGLMWETLTYVSEASECQASREAAAETMRNVSPALTLARGEQA